MIRRALATPHLVIVSNPAMNESERYDIQYYELRNKLQSMQGAIAPSDCGTAVRRLLYGHRCHRSSHSPRASVLIAGPQPNRGCPASVENSYGY